MKVKSALVLAAIWILTLGFQADNVGAKGRQADNLAKLQAAPVVSANTAQQSRRDAQVNRVIVSKVDKDGITVKTREGRERLVNFKDATLIDQKGNKLNAGALRPNLGLIIIDCGCCVIVIL